MYLSFSISFSSCPSFIFSLSFPTLSTSLSFPSLSTLLSFQCSSLSCSSLQQQLNISYIFPKKHRISILRQPQQIVARWPELRTPIMMQSFVMMLSLTSPHGMASKVLLQLFEKGVVLFLYLSCCSMILKFVKQIVLEGNGSFGNISKGSL